jgi:hypothetical protein
VYILQKSLLVYLLLEKLIGIPVAVVFVDIAVLAYAALVSLILAHGPLEETLAAFTAHHPIVPSYTNMD